jgi:hypothetical protein
MGRTAANWTVEGALDISGAATFGGVVNASGKVTGAGTSAGSGTVEGAKLAIGVNVSGYTTTKSYMVIDGYHPPRVEALQLLDTAAGTWRRAVITAGAWVIT